MKTYIGFAIVTKTHNYLKILGANLPIYWRKDVALETAKKFNADVIEVEIKVKNDKK